MDEPQSIVYSSWPLLQTMVPASRAHWTFPLHCPSVTQTHNVSIILFTLPKIPVLILPVGCLCILPHLQDEFLRVIHVSYFSPLPFHTLCKLLRVFLHNCFLKFLGLFKHFTLQLLSKFSSPCFKTIVLTSLLNDLLFSFYLL